MYRLCRIRFALPQLLAIALVIMLTSPTSAAVSSKLCFFDDDWDPIQRGRSYIEDPGYEMWIEDALLAAGIEYDYYEIQTTPDDLQLPTLADLSQYPLIIWNCAAEDEHSLSLDERNLLRDYLALGGKVVLLGQGILNSLNGSDPEVENFIHQVLSVEDYQLDNETNVLLPLNCFFFEPLPPTNLSFDTLPDFTNMLSDHLFPMPNAYSFIMGSSGAGGQSGHVSTDTYYPKAIHFQSAMPEAIGDPALRGEWLRATTTWLGLEGDHMINFIHGSDDFSLVNASVDEILDWSPAANAMVFSSSGNATDATSWDLNVGPVGDTPNWRIGFAADAQVPGDNAGITALELSGRNDLIRMSLLSDPNLPDCIAIRCQICIAGDCIFDQTHDGIPAAAPLRAQVSQSSMPPAIEFRVTDERGYQYFCFEDPYSSPDFRRLRISTGVYMQKTGSRAQMQGWLDDYFFEGDLTFNPTGIAENPVPAATPLLNIHPNPFNPTTTISVRHPAAGRIALEIFDLTGREVRRLRDGYQAAGDFQLTWSGRDDNGHNLPSGLYLLRLAGPSGSDRAKLVLLK
ncbi:MAG: T9SS type A sorting domain-containing protein [bacterium]|nr:T9SS type A sorting domain-containing protein [bacterium]